ncbi:MAG TPA: TonB-dependent receptor plug domain-containing protein, partial [Gemmatimonadaceae bacterium]
MYRLTISAFALLLATASARSQEPATPPYELGEVVVSAEEPVSEASSTLRVVTADDIRAHDAHTLDDALELLPGLDVRTGSDGVPRINVRGFRPRHVLLLLDGVPLNSTYDGQFDPTLIPVEQIAYIKLTPGPSSVLYGANGIAGTINIVTRRGQSDFHGEASAEARDRGTGLLRANVSGGSKRITAFGSASGFRTDGYTAPVPSPSISRSGSEALRGNTDRKRASIFGSVTAAATDHLS